MALECTHIRFALDLKNKFKVKDVKKYISGTIYPDSRYITKVQRDLTHNEKFADKNFYNNNDFKKGWAVHLICDLVQSKILREDFNDIAGFDKGEIKQGNKLWLNITSLKIIQDICDFKEFDIQKYLDCLKYFETPNNEDIAKTKHFYDIIIKMYKDKKEIFPGDAYKMWLDLGLSEELKDKVEAEVEKLLKNNEIKMKIAKIYDKTIAEAIKNY